MVTITDQVSTTFKEYRFIPRLTPEGFDKEKIDFSTRLTKYGKDTEGLMLNLPVLSAAMQSVTGPEMAVAVAQQGGLGVVYCSQSIEDEAMMVKKVKRTRAGFVSNLEVINQGSTIAEVKRVIDKTGYNMIPVVEGDKSDYGKLVGIFEGPVADEMEKGSMVKDWMFEFRPGSLESLVETTRKDSSADQLIRLVNKYIYYGGSDISLEEANRIMLDNRRKYLPIVNNDGTLKFMVFRKDVQAHTDFPKAVVDDNKRYLVGAAINTHDYVERVPALVESGADVILIDASDGFSGYQKKCIEWIKNMHSIPVIAGNIVSGEAFDYLADCGIDGIKVGMGGGSICITQEQKGTGRGQATAVIEVAKHRDRHFKESGVYIPIISDGGIVHAKDIAMALAFGADSVMMGRYLAGCHESPTQIIERDGKRFKEYWGEGSLRAKSWSGNRYGQTEFDEGVLSVVPYIGKVSDVLLEIFAKIRATMTSIGAGSIKELQERAVVELISEASRIEGGVHDVEEIGRERRR